MKIYQYVNFSDAEFVNFGVFGNIVNGVKTRVKKIGQGVANAWGNTYKDLKHRGKIGDLYGQQVTNTNDIYNEARNDEMVAHENLVNAQTEATDPGLTKQQRLNKASLVPHLEQDWKNAQGDTDAAYQAAQAANEQVKNYNRDTLKTVVTSIPENLLNTAKAVYMGATDRVFIPKPRKVNN